MPVQNTLLPLREVINATSLSRSTILRKIANQTFPAPVRVTQSRIAWPSDSIDAYIAGVIASPAVSVPRHKAGYVECIASSRKESSGVQS